MIYCPLEVFHCLVIKWAKNCIRFWVDVVNEMQWLNNAEPLKRFAELTEVKDAVQYEMKMKLQCLCSFVNYVMHANEKYETKQKVKSHALTTKKVK